MQGMTHMAVGCAATLFVLKPKSLPELILGLGVASVGAVISDIDADSSISRKKAETIFKYTAFVAVAIFAIEYLFKIGIYHLLLLHAGFAKILLGCLGAVIICWYGKGQNHRAFMHSFLIMIALSGCAYWIVSGVAIYFLVAYASHLVLDLVNYKGLQLLYPLNPRFSFGWCKADGIVNEILFIAGTTILVVEVIFFTIHILL